MNYEPLWRLTHEHTCVQSLLVKNDEPCTCIPQNRIKRIQHILAGCVLDASTRKVMLQEIEKCSST